MILTIGLGEFYFRSSRKWWNDEVKNIQIVDGADNATFSIFRATESEFGYLFPNPGQDIEFVEDFLARHHEKFATETLNNLWLRPIHKRDAHGIDGTLYYNYATKRDHFPASKREIDRAGSQINSAERELYARLKAESSDGASTVLPATTAGLLAEFPGGTSLLQWFGGRVPSFHDAEVVSLSLDRDNARCNLNIHTFIMTPEVDEKGHYKTKDHVVVSFRFVGVTNLELQDFNEQNVIYGLSVSRSASGDVRLEMEACYGLFGFVEARELAIEIEAGKPKTTIY